MEERTELTPFQLYAMLFLSRVFSLVTYVSGIRGTIPPTQEILSSIVMSVILFLSAIPAAILIKQNNTLSLLERTASINKTASKLIAAVYLFSFVYKGIITAARFELLLGSVMFPETDVRLFVGTLIAASAIVSLLGLAPSGRASIIFLLPVVLAFAFVFLTLIKDFDTLNLSAVYPEDTFDILENGAYTASRTGEIAAVLLLVPYVKKQKASHLFVWIAAFSSVSLLTKLFIGGVLGGFSENQLFNMYSLSILARFGILERMDAVISCIWMVCSVVKLAMIFYICRMLLSSVLEKEKKALFTAVSAVCVFAGMLIISKSIITFTDVIKSPVSIVLYFAVIVVIPISVIIAERVLIKRHEKK